MVVTPACKPPTMKRLRRMAEMRASSWEKFTSGGGGMAIDSAGRMVGVRDVGFGNELKANATPSFDTQGSRQGVMSITEADDIVIKWDGRRHWHRENSDEENDKKNGELEESLTMKRLSRTLRLNEDNENEDDNMSNEMCSPKYDETFQITINHFYTCKSPHPFFFFCYGSVCINLSSHSDMSSLVNSVKITVIVSTE